MASTVTNRGAKDFADGGIASRTFKLILLAANTTSWKTAATARDFNFWSDVSADEASDASYAEQTVTITAAEDDTNDYATLTHAVATFADLAEAAAASGVEGYAIVRLVTDSSDSPLWAVCDLSADIPTAADRTPNGEDFIVNQAVFMRAKTS